MDGTLAGLKNAEFSSKGSRIMRKTFFMLLGAVAGAAITVITIQPSAMMTDAIAKDAPSDIYRQLNLFGDIFERVRSHYVEKPDDSKLVEGAIKGMLNGLDPHSSYMDPKSFRDMQVQTRGEFGGLGIEVTMEDGLVKVVAPIDETPAAKAGIRANDVITHLDDEAVLGMTLDQAVEKMRGLVNTKIKWSARARSAKARCRPSSRLVAAKEHCGSPLRVTTRRLDARSRPRA